MMAYKDVKAKFGAPIAAQILNDKRNQERNKRGTDKTTYFMEHPDAKGQEDPQLHYYLMCSNICYLCMFNYIIL